MFLSGAQGDLKMSMDLVFELSKTYIIVVTSRGDNELVSMWNTQSQAHFVSVSFMVISYTMGYVTKVLVRIDIFF